MYVHCLQVDALCVCVCCLQVDALCTCLVCRLTPCVPPTKQQRLPSSDETAHSKYLQPLPRLVETGEIIITSNNYDS